MDYIIEEKRRTPVIDTVDIVVLGGGCTGSFAAIRAARLGAKVAVVERTGCFGGVATNSFVCVWHTLTDVHYQRQIIAGLTQEVIERLSRIPNGIKIFPPEEGKTPFREPYYAVNHLNTEELKIELDTMIMEAGVHPYLHTRYVAPYKEEGKLAGAIIENSSGRSVLKARFFIDATADGYVGADMGMETYRHETLQPATTAARVSGWERLANPNEILHLDKNKARLGIRAGWDDIMPGAHNVRNWFKSQYSGDCSNADTLTIGEIEGRRQVREMMNILREQDPNGKELSLVALSSVIGIRETRQLVCRYRLTQDDLLYGKPFEDAIGYCAYPIDIHTPGEPTRLFYLDGTMSLGSPLRTELGKWRKDDGEPPAYWQIPYRSMLPGNIGNLLICGRAIDAEKGAFGALRVMISLNQTGEAAGVAAYEALASGKTVKTIDFPSFRNKMKNGGSIVL